MINENAQHREHPDRPHVTLRRRTLTVGATALLPHVVVEISGMTVHLGGYPSNADAITAALTLREYRPQSLD